ncbi:MAG: hypothetical protein H6733_02340 [Alphaproteobacteria bacterium]|nr:hypothetical protein [Alphaproteobacteria bacterium]
MADKSNDVQMDDMKFDVRVLPHSVRRNKITHEQIDAHLASLPDEADEALECAVKFTTPFADRADD